MKDIMHNTSFTKKGKNNKTTPDTAALRTPPPLQPTVMQILLLIFFKASLFSPPPAQAKTFKCTTTKNLLEMMRTLTDLFKHLHSEIVLRHGSQIGLSTHLAPHIAI